MIELININKSYKTKKRQITKVLNDVNLKFSKTGMTFILGKSGSGKSTLLNIIGGLDKYDNGSMMVLDKDTKNFKDKDFDNYRNNYIGFIFQDFNIIEDYTVIENIEIAYKLQNKKLDKNEINELLNKLQIIEYKNRKINELSGGQKQRVAIARALIKKPKIILADEPTGNLDSKTSKEVMDLLKEISKGTLVIMVSHDLELAKIYADRVISIKDGFITNDISRKEFIESTDPYQTIKSKLPFIDAIKLGFISLKNKKVKLFFTILLITFSILFLLTFYKMNSYNVDESHLKLIDDNNIKLFEIKKQKKTTNLFDQKNFFLEDGAKIKNLQLNDIENIANKIKQKIYPIYILDENLYFPKFFNLNIYVQEDMFTDPPEEERDFYTKYISRFQMVEVDNLEDTLDEEITGIFPKNNDEIIISNYMADFIIKNGIYEYNSDTIFYPKNYQELVSSNKAFKFGSYNSVKIVGVIHYDLKKYENLKGKYSGDKDIAQSDFNLSDQLSKKVDFIYNKIYVKKGFVDNLKESSEKRLSSDNTYTATLNGKKELADGIINTIYKEIEYYNGEKWSKTNTLKENEVILNLSEVIDDYSDYLDKLEQYINKYPYKNKSDLEKEFVLNYIDLKKYIHLPVKLEIYEDLEIFVNKTDKKPTKQYDDIKVIGISGLVYSDYKKNYFSKDILGEYIDDYIKIDSVLLKEKNINNVKKLIELFPYNGNYKLYSFYSVNVQNYKNLVIDYFKPFAEIGTYIFLLFSIILISNFMFNSVESRKKDVGILKSLGTGNIDIIKIFLVEGLILTLITTIFGVFSLTLFFQLLNSTMMNDSSLNVSPFYLDIKVVLIMFIYTLLIVFISSLIPLIKISKLKPIDSIYNRK